MTPQIKKKNDRKKKSCWLAQPIIFIKIFIRGTETDDSSE
jgi:hypothetical protein